MPKFFTPAQSNPSLPGNLPNPNFQFQDLSPTIDSLMSAYERMKSGQRADTTAGLQNQVLEGQLAGQNAAQTAQFGRPLAAIPGQEMTQAGAGMEAPGMFSPDRVALFDRLKEGLMKMGGRDPQTLAAQDAARQKESVGLDLTRSQIAENNAQATKLGAEAGAVPAQRGMKAEEGLRGELQKLSKPFVEVRDAYSRIQNVSKNPGEAGAGDLAIIFNYMKMLDPGSTVREGEFANAQNSGGVPDRIIALHNKLKKGDRLSDTQRRDFIERADELYQSQLGSQKRNEEQYRGLSTRMGANPQNVILDQGLPAQPAPTGGPAVGTVQRGFKFLGGNPALPASWARVTR